jgi:hypothetical protein
MAESGEAPSGSDGKALKSAKIAALPPMARQSIDRSRVGEIAMRQGFELSDRRAVGRRLGGAALLIAGLGLASVAGAQVTEDPRVSSLNGYFYNPMSPATFRALSGQGDPGLPRYDYTPPHVFDPKADADDALMARMFPDAEVDRYSGLNTGDCRPEYAARTLKARVARLGESHAYVAQWIAVQSAVFQACRRQSPPVAANAPPAPAPLPPPLKLEPALAKLQAEDRAYQLASLAFYRDDRVAARRAFQAIAASRSPHAASAAYMVAAIGAGTMAKPWDTPEPLVSSARSIAEIKALLADPRYAQVRPELHALMGWHGATRADLRSRRAQVADVLDALETPSSRLAADPRARQRYGLAADDIGSLQGFNDHPDWWLTNGPPAAYTASRAMMEAARAHPLAAWVLFPAPHSYQSNWFTDEHAPASAWARERAYLKTRKAEAADAEAWSRLRTALAADYDPNAWRLVENEQVLALKGHDQALAELAFDLYHTTRRALGASHADPKAFDAAVAHLRAFPLKRAEVFQRARHDGLAYLMATGRLTEARRWRDVLFPPLADPLLAYPGRDDDWAYSDAFLLQALAEDADHYVRALSGNPAHTLDNNLSVAALRRLAARSDLPAPLRAQFSRVAWARTYAQGLTIDAALNRQMRALNPGLTRAWASPADKPVKPDDRRALLDVLRSPGLNIVIVSDSRAPAQDDDKDAGLTKLDLYHHNDANWWCAWEPDRHARAVNRELFSQLFGNSEDLDDDKTRRLREQARPLLASSFAFRSQDAAETGRLAAIPCAPKLLSERALAWNDQLPLFSPWRGRDEALARAVQSTRYGCNSEGSHAVYSKADWIALHVRFPFSVWTARTKYWFA